MTIAVSLDQEAAPIELVWAEIVDGVLQEYLSEKQSYPWIVGFSG